ncbi:TRAP transporter small permease [Aquibium carbonis]|uniref:TRAP transporter small permease protein n=1 Tax=Aquibium carbonis TaxID=2495581 RepID=A0A3R9ZZ05_9HYPH|nr:TRAP transporter small permease [Aquibium carbonis]
MSRTLERVSLAIEMVAGGLLALITLTVVASATSRYLFSYPLPDAFDLSRLLMGAAVMWGLASVGFRGNHIKVDLLSEFLPPRLRRWVDSFAWTVLLGFTCLVAYRLAFPVMNAARSGEVTMELRLPLWPFFAVIWLGVVVSIVTVFTRLVLVATGRGNLDDFDPIEIPETKQD